MANGPNGETGMHRAARRVKESSGGERFWGVVQAISIAAILALFAGIVTMRDDVIVSKAWATDTAPKHHTKTDERLTYLERPELLVRLAQATSAVQKVETAADLAKENAAAIGVIQTEIAHVKDGGTRRERMLERVLDKLDDLKVASGPQ